MTTVFRYEQETGRREKKKKRKKERKQISGRRNNLEYGYTQSGLKIYAVYALDSVLSSFWIL